MNRVHLKPILQLVSLVALIVLGTVVSDRLSRESKPDFRASVKWEQLTTKESQESAPELVVHDHSRADGGYTLYPVSGTEDVLLLDPNGQVAHRWKVDVGRTVLLPNCNLLAIHASKWGLKQPKWRALRDVIREYSWEGEIVWEYKAEDEVHHDLSRLPNGNTLFLQRSMVPDSVRAKIVDESRRKNPIRSDRIVEVNSSREIVWDWYAHDQLQK